MGTLTIAEGRVSELQEALRVALRAKERVKTMTHELAAIDEALERACEAIYNATVYDSMGEKASADDA